jgi:hypothetical protein
MTSAHPLIRLLTFLARQLSAARRALLSFVLPSPQLAISLAVLGGLLS